jgi:branched-chain amino acid transport system ATP-binding protein
MTLLSVENLDVSYGPVQILWSVSLSLEKGAIVSLLGGNGAGKTTTVKAISGMLKPMKGRVVFGGRDMNKLPAHSRVEAGLVQVPEGRKVFPTLSVLENLEMGSFLKHPKSKRAESLERVMALFPILRERTNQAAGTLSGGEQQMLALARGMMSLPKLLILDEPSLGLAPLMVIEIFEAIKEINKEGVSVLLVEQNAPQALSISDMAFVLEEGRIALSGEGQDLLNDDHVRRLYLGLSEDCETP